MKKRPEETTCLITLLREMSIYLSSALIQIEDAELKKQAENALDNAREALKPWSRGQGRG